MIYINADTEGNILSWGTETIGTEYLGDVPEDFSHNDYYFIDSEIVAKTTEEETDSTETTE